MNIYKDFLFQLVQYKCNSLSATKKIYPPILLMYTYTKLHIFTVYILMNLGILVHLWYQHQNKGNKHSHQLQNISYVPFFQCVGGCELTTYTPYSHSMSISFSMLFVMLIAWCISLHLSRRVIFFLIFICIKIWIIVNTLLVFLQCIKAICLG